MIPLLPTTTVRRTRHGAMLLVTVLVSGAVALLISMSIALGGIAELGMGQAQPKSAEVSAIADGCMEEAFFRLSRSSAYAGGALTYGNGNCTILITAAGAERTVWVTATLEKWTKELMATMNVSTVEITDWQENPQCGVGVVVEDHCSFRELETSPDSPEVGNVHCDATGKIRWDGGLGHYWFAYRTNGTVPAPGGLNGCLDNDSTGGRQQAINDFNLPGDGKYTTRICTNVPNVLATNYGRAFSMCIGASCDCTSTLMTTWRFDFNSSATNVTAAGFTGVKETELYTPSKGYGWMVSPQGTDRGGASMSTIALYRDGHERGPMTDGTFRLDLPNGAYDVRAYVGDQSVSHNGIQIHAVGNPDWLSVTPTAAGSFTTAMFTVTVTDGILYFDIRQIPGDSNGWILNGLDIAPIGTLPPAAP